MTYDEALEYIHGVSNFFCKPGLERITALCDMLGHPERELKFIHVAGTNGKGSFCSMTDSVLRAAGYKVGLYTSPYIYEFNERMRVDGENIPNETLCELTEYVKQFADKMEDSPTEFELITAIAFEYFKREKVDVVVLEVGMGGRFDSTNIIRNPLLSVITGIALDHVAFFGDTVEKIAGEKAGIIKDNAPVLYGGEDDVARAVIKNTAKAMGSEYYETDYSALKVNNTDLSGTEFTYRGEAMKISLLGLYQPKNASVVLDAVKLLRARGLKISDSAVKTGLEKATWRARFEIIERDPLVIFDGAHNPQGIRAATDSIKTYFKDRKVCVFTGVLKDKDYNVIAKTLSEITDTAFTITPDNPRALPAEDYAEVLSTYGISATPCKDISEALRLGKSAAKDRDTALCCLGSLYTYVEVIKAL
jgi:dihydrofolate synthase/folylpolyglutamate synthase